jgi:hypothetical protein
MTDPGTGPNRDKFSDSTLKLSERYGIDPARLDAIMGKPKEAAETPATAKPLAAEPTREWINEQRIHQPNVEHVAPEPAIQAPSATKPKEAVKIVDPIFPLPGTTQTRKVKEIKVQRPPVTPPPVAAAAVPVGDPRADQPVEKKTFTYEKNIASPATWIIGFLLLALLASLFFLYKGCNDKPQQAQSPTTITDTVYRTDTLATKDTTAIGSPLGNVATSAAPAANAPQRSSKSRARSASSTSSSTRNVALSTTSSFAAQEKLAELKADGNTRAKITRVNKGGVTLYQVRTK